MYSCCRWSILILFFALWCSFRFVFQKLEQSAHQRSVADYIPIAHRPDTSRRPWAFAFFRWSFIYIYIFNILYIFCIHESVFFNCAKAECGCAWYEQHFAQCCKRIRRALAARKPLAINRETTKIVQEQDLGQNWGNLWDTEHLERIRLLRCYPKFVIVKGAACRYETDGHESWDWRYRIAKAH